MFQNKPKMHFFWLNYPNIVHFKKRNITIINTDVIIINIYIIISSNSSISVDCY